MKPHKHAALIKAWADGAEIEFRSLADEKWYVTTSPNWFPRMEYRIKPKVETNSFCLIQAKAAVNNVAIAYNLSSNVTATFEDGVLVDIKLFNK